MKSKGHCIKHFWGIPFFLLILMLFGGCTMYTAYRDIVNMQKEHEITLVNRVPRLEYINAIPIIHLYGTQREMGEQYGTILKPQLNSMIVLGEGLFSKRKLKSFYEMAEQTEPLMPADIKNFLGGMAEAADVSYRKLLVLNLTSRVTCSVLAVWGEATADGRMLMGRNADFHLQRVNKALGILVVRHPSSGYATVASSFLGLAGTFTGINEKGVAYGNMLVYNGNDEEIDLTGFPIQLLMQMGGEQFDNARAMTDFLVNKQHMIPNNVMCADSDEAFLAELSPSATAVREGQQDVLAATNYFISSGMFTKHVNEQRFANLMQYSKKHHGQFNLNKLQEAMHEARQLNENLQCVLFEPAAMKMHISMNKVPASEGPFTEFDLNLLFNE